MKAAKRSYEDITVGDVYEFERLITKEDVMKFAELTGDHNPLHVDGEFGKKSEFGQNIVHGMLVASLFSTLVGMYCPGENALYLSQTLSFRRPLFIGLDLVVRGTVVAKLESLQVIRLKTQILHFNEELISGEAMVKVLTNIVL